MGTLTAWAALGLAIVLSSLPTAAVAQDDNPQAGIAADIEFRQTFGLRSDREWISAVRGDSSADRSFGTFLSAAEAADLTARVHLQNELGPLKAFLESRPTVFGGLYLDQSAGGIVDVGLTRLDDEIMRNARSLIPLGGAIRFRQVLNSDAVLSTARAAIRADFTNGSAPGFSILSARTDVPGNVIEIGVSPSDMTSASAIAGRYGGSQLIRVVSVSEPPRNLSCVDWFNCAVAPWRGGLGIYLTVPPNDCTSGFVVKGPGASSGRYLMTAGYCSQETLYWTHNGKLLGRMYDVRYHDLMYADAGIIDISDTWDGNIVLIDEGNYRTMTFQQVPAQDHVGDVVCHAGSSTMEAVGYSICGTLTDRDLDYTTREDGYRHLNFRKSNVNARKGDSGGAVYNGHSALGIVASGDGCTSSQCTDMIYSHIYYAVTMPSGIYGVQLTP